MVQAGSKADHPVPGRPKSIVMKESRGSDPTCRSEWQEVLGVMPKQGYDNQSDCLQTFCRQLRVLSLSGNDQGP